MGLDTVELVMEIEDEFQLKIADELYQPIVTLGDLMDYVVDRLAGEGRLLPTLACPNVGAFCRLRRALMRLFAASRDSVRPGTSLERLVPAYERRRVWERLAEELGCSLPTLERPAWMGMALAAVLLLILAVAVAGNLVAQGPARAIPMILAAWLVFALTLYRALRRATESAAVCIPDTMTVGGIVLRMTEAEAAARISAPRGAWTVAEVHQAIRRIFVEQLNVPVEFLRRDARIIEDLKLD